MDINNVHELLAVKKKNKEFDPTLTAYVPNTLIDVKYAITAVYFEQVGKLQEPYMKVSYDHQQLNIFLSGKLNKLVLLVKNKLTFIFGSSSVIHSIY